jgi:hypothetical protein
MPLPGARARTHARPGLTIQVTFYTLFPRSFFASYKMLLIIVNHTSPRCSNSVGCGPPLLPPVRLAANVKVKFIS